MTDYASRCIFVQKTRYRVGALTALATSMLFMQANIVHEDGKGITNISNIAQTEYSIGSA
jgi:hypothetical protein